VTNPADQKRSSASIILWTTGKVVFEILYRATGRPDNGEGLDQRGTLESRSVDNKKKPVKSHLSATESAKHRQKRIVRQLQSTIAFSRHDTYQ
jgi:hypothetical protein